jgi:hypothetical protein
MGLAGHVTRIRGKYYENKILSGILNVTRALKKPGRGGRIILKWIQGKSILTIRNVSNWQQILSYIGL